MDCDGERVNSEEGKECGVGGGWKYLFIYLNGAREQKFLCVCGCFGGLLLKMPSGCGCW